MDYTSPSILRPKKFSLRTYGWFSAFILLLSYSYLAYKLITFDQYPQLVDQLNVISSWQWLSLLGVLILLPLNILMEVFKWKKLSSKVQSLSLATSVKAVLSGMTSGFFTPNRVGELFGRIQYLSAENRKSGVTISLINSLTQNIVMAICGIPACMLLFSYRTDVGSPRMKLILSSVMVGATICMLIYFALPTYSKLVSRGRLGWKIGEFTTCLSAYSVKDLVEIIFFSFVRYAIFCTQFYFMLRFMGVDLSLWQAFLAIPASYLFVTFTPSVAFSELAVRGSYAVFFIGAFSNQVVGIALASMAVWLVNLVFPMLIGSLFLIKSSSSHHLAD